MKVIETFNLLINLSYKKSWQLKSLPYKGAVMIQGARDYVECSKILHPPNFQKSLKNL